MSGAPTYIASEKVDQGRVSVPDFASGEVVTNAVAGFGNALAGLGQKIALARVETQKTDGISEYLRGVDELDRKYTNDTDHDTLETRWKADHEALRARVLARPSLGNMTPQDAAAYNLRLQNIARPVEQGIANRALKRQGDVFLGALGSNEQQLLQRAARTTSPAEREAAIGEYEGQLAGAEKAGWLSAVQVAQKRQAFKATVEDTEAMTMIRDNPVGALDALQDVKRFPTLAPQVRLARLAMAQQAADGKRSGEILNQAQYNPVAATFTLGRGSPQSAAMIFERGVLPQEGGLGEDREGNPVGRVSPAGALGAAQVMPATARYVAGKLGLTELTQMSDERLRVTLLADHDLNRRLGLAYFTEMLGKVDGSIPAALAAYNAGPGNDAKPRAVAWHRQAIEKFGTNYSAEQYASLIPIGETRNYVLQIYKRVGADAAGSRLSAGAQTTTAGQMDGFWQREQAEAARLAGRMAAPAGASPPTDQVDAVIDGLKKGYHQNPEEIAGIKSQLLALATAGKGEAATTLRRIEAAEQVAPVVREAYGLPPEQLAVALARERDRVQREGLTPLSRTRLAALEAVEKEVAAGREKFPLGLARRIDLVPEGDAYDAALTRSPDAPEFAGALRERFRRADLAARHYNAPFVPFSAEETAALAPQVAKMGDDAKIKFLRSIATAAGGTGEHYQASVRALFAGDRMAQLAGRLAPRDEQLARDVLRGAALLGDKDVKPRAATIREALEKEIGGDLYPDPAMTRDVEEAALALYVAERGRSGTLYSDPRPDDLRAAIEKVTGSRAKRGGLTVHAPAGVKPARFDAVLDRIDDSDIARIAGTVLGSDGREVPTAFLRRNMALKQRMPGSAEYIAGLNGPRGFLPLLDIDGAPLQFDFHALERAQGQRGLAEPLTATQQAFVGQRRALKERSGELGRADEAGRLSRIETLRGELEAARRDVFPAPGSIMGRDRLRRLEDELARLTAEGGQP